MDQITPEQTHDVGYALRFALSELVRQITDSREMLASEEGKSAPGAIRKSLEGATAYQEETYARLVRTFATLPESIRPDMRDRRLTLPDAEGAR
ncbi:hypothetical protein [Streptomyces sp. NPDC094144]|uniref:hypothetical protein n=1 Tax=Streptomyces sp. NPDC094144 TaxID=3366056 RepID=UPI003818E376